MCMFNRNCLTTKLTMISKELLTAIRKDEHKVLNTDLNYIEKDNKYLIEFETAAHEVKFLVVNVTITGKFYIDVDFSHNQSARLEFNKNRYKLTSY